MKMTSAATHAISKAIDATGTENAREGEREPSRIVASTKSLTMHTASAVVARLVRKQNRYRCLEYP
jgi:hypothetical protein